MTTQNTTINHRERERAKMVTTGGEDGDQELNNSMASVTMLMATARIKQ